MLPRLLLALVFACATGAVAQESDPSLPTRQAMTDQTEAFMAKLAQTKTLQAYQSIRPYLGVSVSAFDQSAADAETYFQKVTDKAGHAVDYDQVLSESIGNHFHHVVWLQKFPAAAMAWTFTFYQPKEGWKLVGVSYSTELGALYRVDH
ncbi:hypothetical protein [Marinobacter caseinilyticus]|uniref:hypothetical protein n=1 Tax=Marinobacter caseinilyticus TaxID=2692195 RepID=UPI00140A0A56|nr:hypothetical protein [Marinobacter caseinilyticus]